MRTLVRLFSPKLFSQKLSPKIFSHELSSNIFLKYFLMNFLKNFLKKLFPKITKFYYARKICNFFKKRNIYDFRYYKFKSY